MAVAVAMVAAIAPIQPLAQKLPYAINTALKRKKKVIAFKIRIISSNYFKLFSKYIIITILTSDMVRLGDMAGVKRETSEKTSKLVSITGP